MPMLTTRNDLTAAELRRLAHRERDARFARRILAIANALDGMSRAMAAKLGGMDRQTLRDWVIRYNERGVPGLGDRGGPGRPTAVNDGQLAVVKPDEPHRRSGHRFRDRFGVAVVGLLSFYVRLNVFGRHQLDRVPLRFERPPSTSISSFVIGPPLVKQASKNSKLSGAGHPITWGATDRRVVVRIEASSVGLDIRFVVPSLADGSAERIYDALYCAGGRPEYLIKLHKTQLKSDRISCRSANANQMPLILHNGRQTNGTHQPTNQPQKPAMRQARRTQAPCRRLPHVRATPSAEKRFR